MKKLFTVLAVALALFNSCKKESTDSGSANVESSWTLNGVSYKAVATARIVTSGGSVVTLLNFWDAVPTGTNKVNSVALSFPTAPAASGTYQLVGVGAAHTATQFELSASNIALNYAYIGASVDCQVTVTNGKAKVVIPEVLVKCTTTGPDVKFSGSLVEIN